MAQETNNSNSRVIKGWDFKAFRNNYGEVRRPRYVNSQTNTEFTKLAFEKKDSTGWCFVGWSQEMGELTNEELKAKVDELRIVQLEVPEEEIARRKEAGLQLETYKVCEKGNYNQWEVIDV